VRYETVLGGRGRYGHPWHAWESVYSPVGPDGYPRRIWDRDTGDIDPVVLPWAVERILDTAPDGGDVDSWRY
jgi:hypothetical protein